MATVHPAGTFASPNGKDKRFSLQHSAAHKSAQLAFAEFEAILHESEDAFMGLADVAFRAETKHF